MTSRVYRAVLNVLERDCSSQSLDNELDRARTARSLVENVPELAAANASDWVAAADAWAAQWIENIEEDGEDEDSAGLQPEHDAMQAIIDAGGFGVVAPYPVAACMIFEAIVGYVPAAVWAAVQQSVPAVFKSQLCWWKSNVWDANGEFTRRKPGPEVA